MTRQSNWKFNPDIEWSLFQGQEALSLDDLASASGYVVEAQQGLRTLPKTPDVLMQTGRAFQISAHISMNQINGGPIIGVADVDSHTAFGQLRLSAAALTQTLNGGKEKNAWNLTPAQREDVLSERGYSTSLFGRTAIALQVELGQITGELPTPEESAKLLAGQQHFREAHRDLWRGSDARKIPVNAAHGARSSYLSTGYVTLLWSGREVAGLSRSLIQSPADFSTARTGVNEIKNSMRSRAEAIAAIRARP